ncbi:unnamed protein product [Ceutorhynchus assimilis]|uniref:Uncharacterized protein n=1 Tax=Ceutorhynchus assimilis TaxID=467358 RepID=A0A9N9QPL9_9CUCU|nr:unnamed protein product [Ceutorhynchus assimilis]
MNITTIQRESKIFILSSNDCLVNLLQNNKRNIRLGDKIIYWNERKPHNSLSEILHDAGVDTQTLHDFLPLIKVLKVNDAAAFTHTNQSYFDESFMNTREIFTIATFETKLHHGEIEYLRLDTFVMEILAKSIHLPYVYIKPTRYEGYAGVFDLVASGDAQIVLNSWFLVEKIAIENKPTDVGIKTVEEFVRTKNPIFCTKNIAIGLRDLLENDKLGKQLLPRIKTYSNLSDNSEEEHILTNCTTFAVILARSSARYFSNLAKEQGLDFCYNLIPEAVVPSIVTYLMAYKSPFHEKIDKIISRIFENGLIANFTADPIVKTQEYNEELEKSGLTTFRERLPWIVYLCGIFLATIVFIFEAFIWPKLIGQFKNK